MLFQRLAHCLDEEINNGNKWVRFIRPRNGAYGISMGLFLWVILLLPLLMLLPEKYCVPPYSKVIILIWLGLLIFAIVLGFIIRSKYNKGEYDDQPGKLTEQKIKMLAYILSIVPAYLLFALLLATWIFVFYKIYQEKRA